MRSNVPKGGGAGTGKSHPAVAVAVAIARARIRNGTRGRFFNAVNLVNRLDAEARADRQGRTADLPCRLDFPILDVPGHLPSARTGGQSPFHLISRLHERTSVIVTTNLAFGEWPGVSGDARMTTASPDRLTRHRDILETGNESWRFRTRARAPHPPTRALCAIRKPPRLGPATRAAEASLFEADTGARSQAD